MQDKTINNALLALYKAGGEQADIAEALLNMRGVPLPVRRVYDRQMRRGQSRRLVLGVLSEGPCLTGKISDKVQEALPGISRRSACQRVHMTLRRLEAAGMVRREGRVWRLALRGQLGGVKPYDL